LPSPLASIAANSSASSDSRLPLVLRALKAMGEAKRRPSAKSDWVRWPLRVLQGEKRARAPGRHWIAGAPWKSVEQNHYWW
jgi:hypothetical protein